VFAVDCRQSIILWNQRATRILGFTAEEVLGKKCYKIVGGRDARGCDVCRRDCNAIASAQGLQPAPTTDLLAQIKGGADVWLNLSTVIVPSRRRDLSVLVHLFREVTRDHDVLSVAQDLADMVSTHASKKRIRRSRDVSSRSTRVELTRREHEILILLASGVSTDVIAEKLHISPRTVRNHVNNTLGKLDVHSRLEAVAYSIRTGLI
jgi:PAS domain S-box-containing protein